MNHYQYLKIQKTRSNKGYIYLIIILKMLLWPSYSFAQQEISWTSFEHLNDSLRKERKPLMIYVYTDWCKYCKMQDNSTFNDTELSKYLSSNFYCLKLNAEEKNDIIFLNRTYRFKSSGAGTGQHELAEFLAKENGDVHFPATIFLSTELEFREKLIGFQSVKEIYSVCKTIKTTN